MTTTTLSPVTQRFAWKEYRTLRVLWLAVLFLGVFIQVVSAMFSAPSLTLPAVMLGTALGAAILYAVAAAAILFSGEHEDGSYHFLIGLPVRWLPMTTGKLAIATGSAVAIAVPLIVIGWLFAGFRFPPTSTAKELFALLGVGIFEALAWATLFSLLVKRPLTAVALAVVVGILVVQLASAAFSENSTGLGDLATYSRAVPLRLAILALILVGIVNIARGWLGTLPRSKRNALLPVQSDGITLPTPMVHQRSASAMLSGPSRFKMLFRLMWQAWRQSWKSLLLPFSITISLGLCAALLSELPAIAGVFVPPALIGALAFSGDQRHRHYRYLAEHAARPRYVWLSRHILWLGNLVGTMLILTLLARLLVHNTVLPNLRPTPSRIDWPISWALESVGIQLLNSGTERWVWIAGLIGLTTILAYAVGQLVSLTLRSEIIATLLSAILSVLITAWALVLLLWFLSAWWFTLPIAAGLFLATWLRAPDWMIERNSWQAWWKPVLAAVAPLVLVGLSLPVVRLLQVPNYHDEIAPLFSGDTQEARKTAAMYDEAIKLSDAWKQSQLLERWSGPEFAKSDVMYETLARDGPLVIIDESKIPADERADYRAAVEAVNKLSNAGWEDAAKLAIEASRRTECHLDISWDSISVPSSYDPNYRDREAAWQRVHAEYHGLLRLAENLFSSPLEDQISCLVAAVRICEHAQQRQPTGAAARALSVEARALRAISHWAKRDAVTADELRELKTQLELHFQRSTYDPKTSILADHLLVKRVVDGDAEPLIFDQRPIRGVFQLAYLVNQLPWERARAELALDAITAQNLRDLGELDEYLDGRNHHSWNVSMLGRWLQLVESPQQPPTWLKQQPAASTSYLTSFEYQSRVSINIFFRRWAEVKNLRRAILLQLALQHYSRDHRKYPDSLSDLVPDYLPEIPIDPYSRTPFRYSPGLDLPLWTSQFDEIVTLPARSPFFWSVGPNGVEMTRLDMMPGNRGDANGVPGYTFQGRDERWHVRHEFVFPLPKLPLESRNPSAP